jgi:predicted Fe-S protein YdhL (DUF1289 family)
MAADSDSGTPRSRPAEGHTVEVPSPCVLACSLDEVTQTCAGCARTIEEIVGWRTFDRARRLAVWDRLRALASAAGPGR